MAALAKEGVIVSGDLATAQASRLHFQYGKRCEVKNEERDYQLRETALLRRLIDAEYHQGVRMSDLEDLSSWPDFPRCRLALGAVVSCAYLDRDERLRDLAMSVVEAHRSSPALLAVLLMEASYGGFDLIRKTFLGPLEITVPSEFESRIKTKPGEKRLTWKETIDLLAHSMGVRTIDWLGMPPVNRADIYDFCRRVTANSPKELLPQLAASCLEMPGVELELMGKLRQRIVEITLDSERAGYLFEALRSQPVFLPEILTALSYDVTGTDDRCERSTQFFQNAEDLSETMLGFLERDKAIDRTKIADVVFEEKHHIRPWFWYETERLLRLLPDHPGITGFLLTLQQESDRCHWRSNGSGGTAYHKAAGECYGHVDCYRVAGMLPLGRKLDLAESCSGPCADSAFKGFRIRSLMRHHTRAFVERLTPTIEKGEANQLAVCATLANVSSEEGERLFRAWLSRDCRYARTTSEQLEENYELIAWLERFGISIAGTKLSESRRAWFLWEAGYHLRPTDIDTSTKLEFFVHDQQGSDLPFSNWWTDDLSAETLLTCEHSRARIIRSMFGSLSQVAGNRTDWIERMVVPHLANEHLLRIFCWVVWDPTVATHYTKPGRQLIMKEGRFEKWMAPETQANAKEFCKLAPVFHDEPELVKQLLGPQEVVKLLLDGRLLKSERELAPASVWVEYFQEPATKRRWLGWFSRNQAVIKYGAVAWINALELRSHPIIRGWARQKCDDREVPPEIIQIARGQ